MRASGRECSYQAKPPASPAARMAKAPSCQLIRRAPPLAADQEPDAVIRRQRLSRPTENPGRLGGEVGAAGENLGGRAVGDDPPVGQQHDARGEAGHELGVVGGHDRGRLSSPSSVGQMALVAAVHAPRRLVEADQRRGARGILEDDGQGEALALPTGEVAGRGAAPGLRRGPRPTGPPQRPRRPRCRGRGSRSDSGAAGPRRPAACTRPRRRAHEPGGVAQQRRLAGAVAPHEGDSLARCDLERERRAGSAPRRWARARRGAGAGPPPAWPAPDARAGARGPGAGAGASASPAGGSSPRVAQGGPRALDPGHAGTRPSRPSSRAPGVCSSGACSPPRSGTPPAAASQTSRPRSQSDDPVRGGQTALEAVLGEQDGGVEVLVEPAQRAEQLVAGHRIELGGRLVEHDERRAARRGPRRARPAEAPRPRARPSSGRAGRRCPERQRRLLDCPGHRAGASPRFSSGKASSARGVPMTTCVSGSWNSVPTAPASSPGPCARVSRPATTARPANAPPWKWGTSPLATRSRVDFPEPEMPTSTTSSPGSTRRLTSCERGRLRTGIGVAHALEGEHAHGSMPRRSRKGEPGGGQQRRRRP